VRKLYVGLNSDLLQYSFFDWSRVDLKID